MIESQPLGLRRVVLAGWEVFFGARQWRHCQVSTQKRVRLPHGNRVVYCSGVGDEDRCGRSADNGVVGAIQATGVMAALATMRDGPAVLFGGMSRS